MDAFKTLTEGAAITSSPTLTSVLATAENIASPIATQALWLLPNTIFGLALMNLFCFYGIAMTDAMEIPLELLQDNVNSMLQHGSANLPSAAAATTEFNRLQNVMEHGLSAQEAGKAAKIASLYRQDVADIEMPNMLPQSTSASSLGLTAKEALLSLPINNLDTIRELAMNGIDNEEQLNEDNTLQQLNADNDDDITDNETTSGNDILKWLGMHEAESEAEQQKQELQQEPQQLDHYAADLFYPQEQQHLGSGNLLQQIHSHKQHSCHNHAQQTEKLQSPSKHHHSNRQVHSNSAKMRTASGALPLRRCSIEISSKIPGICQTMGSIGKACVSGDYIDVFNGECL